MFGNFREFWKRVVENLCLRALRILEGNVFKTWGIWKRVFENLEDLEKKVERCFESFVDFGRECLGTLRIWKRVVENLEDVCELGEFENLGKEEKGVCEVFETWRLLEEKGNREMFENFEDFGRTCV